jgi:Predicted integral membrane protein
METVEKKIEISSPLSKVFNQWTQFEKFPQFMEGVEKVIQLDETHLHWVAQIGGKRKEWDAEITEQVPDQRIAWRSITGAPNAGIVSFRPKDPNHTMVSLQMSYEPEGALENIGDSLGLLSRRVESNLKRFRNFVQKLETETGAWRGEVQGSEVKPELEYDSSGKSGLD